MEFKLMKRMIALLRKRWKVHHWRQAFGTWLKRQQFTQNLGWTICSAMPVAVFW